MTPEDRRVLYEVLERVTSTDVKLDGLTDRLTAHEKDDKSAHRSMRADISELQKDRTKLFAYYAAAAVVVPVLLWILDIFKASAAAL